MIEACRAGGVILAIGHMRRFNKAFRLAKRLISDGALGQIALIRSQWDDPDPAGYYTNRGYRASVSSLGGLFQDRGTHVSDLATWWTDSAPTTVSACIRAIAKARVNEDMVCCTIEYRNGAISTFESTSISNTPWREEHRIFGTDGTLVIRAERLPSISTEPPRMLLYRNARKRGNCEIADVTPYNELSNIDDEQAAHNNYLLELEDFAGSVAEGRSPEVSGVEGRSAIEVVNAAYISAARAEKVSIPLEEAVDLQDLFRRLVEQPGNHIL